MKTPSSGTAARAGGPIADESLYNNRSSDPYTAVFEGNSHVIYNMFIDRTGDQNVVRGTATSSSRGCSATWAAAPRCGTWGWRASRSTFIATPRSAEGADGPEVYAGGLAGYSAGEIFKTYVTGSVTAVGHLHRRQRQVPPRRRPDRAAGGRLHHLQLRAGRRHRQPGRPGLRYSTAYAGGLVAYQDGGNIVATYARGTSTATVFRVDIGRAWRTPADSSATTRAARSSPVTRRRTPSRPESTSASAFGQVLNAGGLVGTQDGGKITASYSVGMAATAGNVVNDSNPQRGRADGELRIRGRRPTATGTPRRRASRRRGRGRGRRRRS